MLRLAMLGLLSLGAGCISVLRGRDRETELCPTMDECVCSEKTGVVRGGPIREGDHFVRIGSEKIDTRKELFTHKISSFYGYAENTYPPQKQFLFKLGMAEPANEAVFRERARHLTEKLLDVIIGKYRCVQRQFSDDFVIYVSGHTDRLGEDFLNKALSEARAMRVAIEVQQWLMEHRAQLIQPVRIEYIGRGEAEEEQAGKSYNDTNPKARKVDVIALTVGPPSDGDWKELGTIYP